MATNVREFNLALQEASKRLPAEGIVKLQRAVTLELVGRVMQRSPVDTGRFRGNWLVSEGEPATAEVEVRDPAEVRAQAEAETANLEPYGVVYLTNNVEYASVLENGHSQQAPAGVLAISVEEINAAFARPVE